MVALCQLECRTFLDAKYSGVAALFFKVDLQLVPRAKGSPTAVANDVCLRTSVNRDPQPDGKPMRAFQFVVEVFGAIGLQPFAPMHDFGKLNIVARDLCARRIRSPERLQEQFQCGAG